MKETIDSLSRQRFREDIRTVIDYLWHDEKRHYKETPSRNHIYLVLRRLAREIKG
jgi:hypothetical protein